LTVRAKDFSIWFKDDLYTSEYYREITNRNRVNAWLVYIALVSVRPGASFDFSTANAESTFG